jgi:hypothetical protein
MKIRVIEVVLFLVSARLVSCLRNTLQRRVCQLPLWQRGIKGGVERACREIPLSLPLRKGEEIVNLFTGHHTSTLTRKKSYLNDRTVLLTDGVVNRLAVPMITTPVNANHAP